MFPEIRKHSLATNHSFKHDNFSILAKNINNYDIHIAKSLFIHTLKPKMNNFCTSKRLLGLDNNAAWMSYGLVSASIFSSFLASRCNTVLFLTSSVGSCFRFFLFRLPARLMTICCQLFHWLFWTFKCHVHFYTSHDIFTAITDSQFTRWQRCLLSFTIYFRCLKMQFVDCETSHNTFVLEN